MKTNFLPTKIKFFTPLLIAGTGIFILASCHPKINAPPLKPQLTPKQILQADIMKGKQLVAVSGCEDCHTPWKMGKKGIPFPEMNKNLSGAPAGSKSPNFKIPRGYMVGNLLTHAYTGPWGTSFPSNLTPDKTTGIGNWSFKEFETVIRTGKYQAQGSKKGTGRPLMPPMPWQDYAQFSTRQLHDIYDYLMSLKPVSNNVPQYVPPHH